MTGEMTRNGKGGKNTMVPALAVLISQKETVAGKH